MCGIAGFVSTAPEFSLRQLIEMRDTLVSRGPDGAGAEIWGGSPESCSAGLAHRRLSIIDLSSAGHQPMANEDGSIWISYNGEFYNFQKYRRELEAKGHVFRSHCDTETIIHLYEEYGIEETLHRINGMFAFALWDQKKRKLFIARDRAGQKPLFYMARSNGAVLFASEIKALKASGLVDEQRIDERAFAQFWTYGYAGGDRTFYQQIRKLPPAHYAVWEDGHLSVQRYWQVAFGVQTDNRTLSEQSEELEDLLTDSIRLRLIADVPLGLFLSGGIDSSLIAALAARKLGLDVPCYTIGFNEKGYDESHYAAAVAGHLGLKHTIMQVGADQMAGFETIADYYDEPFSDPSAVPAYYVCKLARQAVTVVLSGDGADELFAGYSTYPAALAMWGSSEERRMLNRFSPDWPLRARLAARYSFGEQQYNRFSALIGLREYFKLMTFRVALGNLTSRHCERNRSVRNVCHSDLLSRLQHLDFHNYMHEEVLTKVDRASMVNSLECRSPFMDYRIIEFASRLPRAAKLAADGAGKVILRNILAKYVPESLWVRPKMGFAAPFEQWMAGAGSRELNHRWRALKSPLIRKNSAETVFPSAGRGNSRLMWNGFSALRFLQ